MPGHIELPEQPEYNIDFLKKKGGEQCERARVVPEE